MTYPITIVDNFFEDPDKIVEFAESLEYTLNDGRYPGYRSPLLSDVNREFDNFLQKKYINLFYHDPDIIGWRFSNSFQKVWPHHEDQYHAMNRGMMHRDGMWQMGGIVYLTKDPEPDTGTSLYNFKYGYDPKMSDNLFAMHQQLNRREEVDPDVYQKEYDFYADHFVETVRVDNVYNRLVIFNSQQWHGIKTYGTRKDRPRLTLPLFGGVASLGTHPPLLR